MNASKQTIGSIFNGGRILEIPYFQRAYVWGEEQWERFLEDMKKVSELNRPYFLGSIILKQQNTNTNYKIGDVRTVIDGQQRLTTLIVFFKVLSLKQKVDKIFKTFLVSEGGDYSDEQTTALKHNVFDNPTFQKICSLSELSEIEPKDRITELYNYFKDKMIETDYNSTILKNNLVFIGIDIDYNEDEQQIFDTINSLGVSLTTAELLKNYFFNRNYEKYEKYWKNLFESDDNRDYWNKEIYAGGRKRQLLDIFFDAFLQIKVNTTDNISTEDRKLFSKDTQLFNSYKIFIKNYYNDNTTSLLEEIKDYAEVFHSKLNPEIIDEDVTENFRNFSIDRISCLIFGLDVTTLIPYVLYVLKNQPDENEQNKIFEYLESYYFRRMIVQASTKSYGKLFCDRFIGNGFLMREELIKFVNNQDEKDNYFPLDDEVIKGFHQNKLINKQTSGILYFIESKIKNEKSSTNLFGLTSYSLEHLMPKKWEQYWSVPEMSAEDKLNRDRTLLTLGNLAIIKGKLNGAIKNFSWENKKYGKNNDGLKAHATGIETLGKYLDLQEWNEEEIRKRADDLSKIACTIWKEFR